jgi:hypothetical protein
MDWPSAATIGNRVYVVGGYDGFQDTGHMAYYEVGATEWTVLADAPFTVSHAYAVAAGGKMYLVTGAGLQVYDPGSGWAANAIALPSGNNWTPAVVGDLVYLVGDGGADVHIKRLNGTSWAHVTAVTGINLGYWSHVAGTR